VVESGLHLARLLAVAAMVLAFSGCDSYSTAPKSGHGEPPVVRFTEPPSSVLFVGNSATYYNGGVESHLRGLAASEPKKVSLYVESEAAPNQTIRGHFDSPRTRTAISRREWDVVVLQGATNEPIASSTKDSFLKYSGLLAVSVKETGARPALFMTWAYLGRPGMTNPLRNAYVAAGNNTNALVVPVGLAWDRILQERSTNFLYSDGRHPSIEGTYLAACVFYASLFGESPEGLRYTAGLPPTDAAYLQRIAWETTVNFFRE